ncbi:hydroxypyruvate isomerase [Variovorax sp. PBS-H4]|uniref:sugar phosphate isomerase/epimerase family protein n=1 Tax=Variovorax sp. PBS-H4 TaxID=434008 RepID=UPI001316CBFB|nr:sugar phosphate isomerase/epimerase family protein [Variovorax sp. PBS-H4]VTU22311.1 hydroxypyruvate isomerase [Variovorax sp. PBS-H4]
MTPSRLAINQITTKSWSLEQAIVGYARAGVHGIGVWRDKLQQCGIGRARSLLRDAQAWVPSLCKAGDLAAMRAHGASAALDDCRRACDEAAEIGAPTVVFVCGGIGGASSLADARTQVAELLLQAAEYAAKAGVTLGIEPFHPMHAAERGCINTLRQAHALRQQVGPSAKVVFDVFHCWWDPDVMTYTAAPYTQETATVQLCDWRVPTRHPVTDRAMVGDGVADIAAMVRQFEANGYTGPYEIEIFSEDWWAVDPAQVVATCIDRYRQVTASAALAH